MSGARVCYEISLVDQYPGVAVAAKLARRLRDDGLNAMLYLDESEGVAHIITTTHFEQEARVWAQGCMARLLAGDTSGFKIIQR